MPLGLVTCEHEAFWLKLLKTSWTPSKGTKLRFWVSLQDPFISTCLCSVCAWLATRKPGGFGAKQWKVYMKNVIIYSSAKSWAVPLHSAQRPVYTCLQHLLNIYKFKPTVCVWFQSCIESRWFSCCAKVPLIHKSSRVTSATPRDDASLKTILTPPALLHDFLMVGNHWIAFKNVKDVSTLFTPWREICPL